LASTGRVEPMMESFGETMTLEETANIYLKVRKIYSL
jgi:hypothetical protein